MFDTYEEETNSLSTSTKQNCIQLVHINTDTLTHLPALVFVRKSVLTDRKVMHQW